jgi:putative protease
MISINSATPLPSSLEVLAPAGSLPSLIAAIRCGADAVYLGGGDFNARRHAQNFDKATLREAVELCHTHGVKVHFALNTLIRQDELSAALALAQEVCSLGVDALIVQDLGLARMLHACAEAMPLHASTQLSCHTPAGVRELTEIGFSRVVLAREMSREEIAECAGQGAALEIFAHGALCMSVSGQCQLSAMLGGRSGNRGFCAQPCRLPFIPSSGGVLPSKEDMALSLRDLSLYDYVGEMAALGISSIKIEGRMKRPEYVAAATASYVDARNCACDSQNKLNTTLFEDLQRVFSRCGFTDGYYTNHRDASMFGFRRYEDVTATAPVLNRLQQLYDKEQPRVPVTLMLTMHSSVPLTLTATDRDGNCVTVTGGIPQLAVHRPLNGERAAAQLEKTGGTPFLATAVCDIEDGLTVPLSALNGLRREALDALYAKRAVSRPVVYEADKLPTQPLLSDYPLLRQCQGKRKLIARFSHWEQIPAAPDADLLIIPLNTPKEIQKNLSPKYVVGVEIPRGMFGNESDIVKQLETAFSMGTQAVLCNTVGAIPLARKAGMKVVGGFGLNITNKEALNAIGDRGVNAAVLSQELNFKQMHFARNASIPIGILAYGRQPLMLMRNCPYKAVVGCAACKGTGSLTDRKGVKFPLQCSGGCTELLNSVPLYLADRTHELPPLDFILLHFTIETAAQTAQIINEYRHGGFAPPSFTRGLYKRGVD